MAKADGDTTTLWIPLGGARALVTEACGSVDLAEKLLVGWLRGERVRWRCKQRLERKKENGWARLAKPRPDWGDELSLLEVHGFPPYAFSAYWFRDLEINWSEHWARERVIGVAYVIDVLRADVLVLLPARANEQLAVPVAAGSAKPRRRYRRAQVDPVVAERWPQGLPEELSTVDALKILGDELERLGIEVPSRDTMVRALGRN